LKILSFAQNSAKSGLLVPYLRSRLAILDETSEIDEVLDLARFYEYDAIILRLFDEGQAELDLIRKLRFGRVRAPVVVLANTLTEAGRLRVLQSGAEDLIVGALSLEEIFIKIQNLVRRSRGFQENSIRIGDVEINVSAKQIYAKGQLLTLTKKEYQIAEILALRKGAVLSKEAILDHLYGGLDEPHSKIIDVFICKIRKKLLDLGIDDFIETHWGRGYVVMDRSAEAKARGIA
jgi:two-component system cell cycle response regulator CtrA